MKSFVRRFHPLLLLIPGCAIVSFGRLLQLPGCGCKPISMALTCRFLQAIPTWSYIDVEKAAHQIAGFGIFLTLVAIILYLCRGEWRAVVGIVVLLAGYFISTSLNCFPICGEIGVIASQVAQECANAADADR
jgi:hypothetical protein